MVKQREEEGRPCLVGQRGDLSLTWREEEGGNYRRLWAEEEGAYQVLRQDLSGWHQAGRDPCFLFLFETVPYGFGMRSLL